MMLSDTAHSVLRVALVISLAPLAVASTSMSQPSVIDKRPQAVTVQKEPILLAQWNGRPRGRRR